MRGANAVAEAMGYGKGFHALDDDTIRRFVGTRWASGKSYSEAIWGDSERVAAWVQDDMAKALARGESWRRLCDELSRRFVGVSGRDVMRLVVTEGAYVSRQAQLAELAREGFEEYRVEPVGDERSREVCSALVGKAFPIDGARVGATLPPIHPRCRCQIAPAVDDWDAWIRDQVDRRQAKIAAGRVGGVGARKASDGSTPSHNVILRGKQFGKKARKHAGEWGLDVSSEEDRRTFCDITAEIIDGADDVVHGEWRGQGTECTFYIKGNDVVIVNGYDEYVTTMRGGASNAQVKHAGDKDAKRRGRQEVHEVL